MISIGNLTSYTPPVAIAPMAPDFKFCHAAYGLGLRRQDGIYAGGILPVGDLPVLYSATSAEEGGQAQSNVFPFSVQFGSTKISVEVAGPIDYDKFTISLVPNRLRGMAAYLANTCVGTRGMGGFATMGFQGLLNFVTDPLNSLDVPEYPISAAFITLSMTSLAEAHSYPGDHDPVIARVLAQAETNVLETVPQQYHLEIADRVVRYTVQSQRMSRLGRLAWWNDEYNDANSSSILNLPAQSMNESASDSSTSRRKRKARR